MERRAWLLGIVGGPAMAALSTMLSPTMALGALGALIGGIILLLQPTAGLFLTVIVVPLERIGRFSNDSSMVTFSLMRVVGLATLGVWGVRQLLARDRFRWNWPLTLYAVFLALGIGTISYSTDVRSGIRTAGAMAGNLMFLFLICNLVRRLQQVKAAIALWLAISVSIAAFTAYQWHRNSGRVQEDRFASTGERSTDDRFSTILEEASEYEMSTRMPRAMGPTSHPAVYAINNILTLPFLAWWITRRISWKLRLLGVVGAALIAYNILLTNTRAALISLVVTGAMLFAVKLLRLNIRIVGAVAGLGLLAIPFVPNAIWERIFDPSNYTTARSATLRARLIYWEAGFDIITENPMTGIGLGNQAEIPKRISGKLAMPENSTVHNEFIQSTMEVGIVIVLVLFAFLAMVARRLTVAERRYRQREDEDTARLLSAMRVCMVATLAYGLQVDVLHFPLKGWWLAMGLGMCLFDFSRRGLPEGDTV